MQTGEPLQLDIEFIQWFATLGIGGVLAGFMFVFYRKDVKQYTELWKLATEQMTQIVKENTASNTKLISLIESQERNSLRRSDIERFVDRRVMEQGYRSDRRRSSVAADSSDEERNEQ